MPPGCAVVVQRRRRFGGESGRSAGRQNGPDSLFCDVDSVYRWSGTLWSTLHHLTIQPDLQTHTSSTDCTLKAKFHYTGPTGPDLTRGDPHGPARTLSETRTDQRSFSGPCGSGRVRVVEFSLNNMHRLVQLSHAGYDFDVTKLPARLPARIRLLCDSFYPARLWDTRIVIVIALHHITSQFLQVSCLCLIVWCHTPSMTNLYNRPTNKTHKRPQRFSFTTKQRSASQNMPVNRVPVGRFRTSMKKSSKQVKSTLLADDK